MINAHFHTYNIIMSKIKTIIGSVLAAGVIAAGGVYAGSNGESNEDAVTTELVKKKKNKHRHKNKNHNDNYGYKQRAVNDNARRYANEPSTTRYDETILLPAIRGNQGGVILRRKAYTALYDKNMRIPRWVAWHLTRQHTYGRNSRKNAQFAEDESVGRPRATDFDYMSSGYDRGHMCPAGDRKWDAQALQETFLFSNCCPQLHGLNSGDWNDLEIQCREWAQKYGSLYIVCGPVLRGVNHKTIGKNRVVVPEAFFKVILCMDGTPKALGFIYEHVSGHKNMGSRVCSVDQVERITGFDFFAALPDNVENRVEATANFSEWR